MGVTVIYQTPPIQVMKHFKKKQVMCGQYNREISTSTNDRLLCYKPILPPRSKGDGEGGQGCESKVDYNAAAQKLRN